MGAVYLLTLRQLAGRWRIIVMTILATLPVVIAAMMVRSDGAPSVQDFEQVVLSAILAGAVTPLVVLAIAGAAFANELEDRTLANLTLSPLPRWKIVVPKLLGAISIAAPFILASAFLTSYVAFLGDMRAVLAVSVGAFTAVALYAAAFLWLGLVSTQAIGVGLLYIVLWEGFFAGFVAGVRFLSIRHHAMGLMHALDPRRFAWTSHLEPGVAAATAALVFAAFVLFAIRRLRMMDVP